MLFCLSIDLFWKILSYIQPSFTAVFDKISEKKLLSKVSSVKNSRKMTKTRGNCIVFSWKSIKMSALNFFHQFFVNNLRVKLKRIFCGMNKSLGVQRDFCIRKLNHISRLLFHNSFTFIGKKLHTEKISGKRILYIFIGSCVKVLCTYVPSYQKTHKDKWNVLQNIYRETTKEKSIILSLKFYYYIYLFPDHLISCSIWMNECAIITHKK